jgi:hypothetical protein
MSMLGSGFRSVPPAPPPPPLPLVGESETFSNPFDCRQNAGQILPVYSTKRRWKAIDVYVQTTGNFFLGPLAGTVYPAIGILVFAVVGSTRTLVGTGRLGIADAGVPTHVCSVHDVLADHFDVALDLSNLGNGTFQTAAGGAVATVSVIASDQATTQADNVGVVAAFAPGGGGGGSSIPAMLGSVQALRLVWNGTTVTDARFRIHGIDAVGDVASRWLQLFDTTAPLVNAQIPIFSIGVPHNAGAIADNMPSPFVANPALRAYRFKFGIGVAVSSTPRTLTLAGANEVAYQVWYR